MIEVVKYKSLEDGKTRRVFIIGKEAAVNSILDAFYYNINR